jgi:amino acid adenylation domain-containing protein
VWPSDTVTHQPSKAMSATGQAFAASPYQRALHAACDNTCRLQARLMLRITGPVEAEELRKGLEMIVTRHSALRSRLTDHGGMLAQVIEPAPSLAWNNGSGAIVTAELRAKQPDEHELRLEMPAAIVDAPSFMTITRELADYLAKRKLPEDPVQFIEFADWRNDALDLSRTTLAIPPRPARTRSEYRVNQTVEVLESRVAAGLARTAEELGVELQDCILAAWIAYLARRTPKAAASIRIATDYRSLDAGLAGLVGPATSFVPIHVECELFSTFEHLAKKVALARAGLGEVKLEVASVPSTGGIGFDVDACPVTVRAGDIGIDLMVADACAEPLALRLTWGPLTSSLKLTAEHDWASLSVAKRTLEGLIVLLSAAVDSVRSPIGALPVIGADEKAWLNEVAVGPALPAYDLLPTKILTVANCQPDRRAVDDDTISWSYSELVDRACRVAAAIRPHAGRGKIVAIIAEPSAPTLAAMLGVMLSGAAYVPIDPALPRRRVAQILDDCRASAVLTRGARENLPTNRPVFSVDDLPTADESRAPQIEPGDLAYVMYTSGSTGMPKGVMITHGGLASYAAFAASAYGINGDVTAIVSSPFAFDLSLTTLLVPLTVGRQTVIVPPSPEGVLNTLEKVRGDVLLKITPRHLNALVTQLPSDAVVKIKTVVVGGEQLSAETVARWRSRAPDCLVFNEYGPTETVVGCCVYEVSPEAPAEHEVIPIGVPIAGATLHVLDEKGQLAPAGTVGELYIGGAGVARGYLGTPGLTAARFVPDPFAGGGGRLFRTGDRVRRNQDGLLIFVGRIDDQLKLRGYRVEPGEVEAILQQHPSVSVCAVVRSGQLLTAFVVSSTEAVDSTALARHVAEWLPEYMVPTRFIAIDQLPITSNGKLDRAALTARRNAREAGRLVTVPRTEMEHLVSRVWCDLIEVDRVDIDARFLETGGDSLMLIEAAAQLQEQAGKPVPPAMFFEYPTVRSLAAVLSGTAHTQAAEIGKERAARRATLRAKGRR